MPSNVTDQRLGEFLAALKKRGGSAGNSSLRMELGWDTEFYWKVQGRLVERGDIVPGRGRGGSVKLSESIIEREDIHSTYAPSQTAERDLYAPLKGTIESAWIKRFGFDDVIVDETHTRGSKDTGGTFTRPDITAAGIRRYVYLPKTLEIITFEVKTDAAINVLGVLEAIAHRESANRSYVIYSTTQEHFGSSPESERIIELAQKYGVGIILVSNGLGVDEWEVTIEAVRHEPDPSRLDRFLGDLPSQKMKTKLSKWKE